MTDEKLLQYIKGELDEAGRDEVVSWIRLLPVADIAADKKGNTLELRPEQGLKSGFRSNANSLGYGSQIVRFQKSSFSLMSLTRSWMFAMPR